MVDPSELHLVAEAFKLACGSRGYVTGYVEWDENAARVSRGKLARLDGLSPEFVREPVIDFVEDGGVISQHEETREDWKSFRFYYKVILMVPGVRRGVFVELRLIDDDPENPAVLIVSAHAQGV